MPRENMPRSTGASPVEPYIPASRSLPEITVKSFILSALLTIIMAAANAYLGLKLGQTIAATIPAAVISMTVLKFFRRSNILENNIVQTTVAAGEGIAAATVFTIPALVMMHYWTEFPYWTLASILAVGGTLGVLFTVPLRRAFIIDSNLKFPEGIAAAEVLKVGDSASRQGAKTLLMGGLLSALLKFFQSCVPLCSDSVHYFRKVGGTVLGTGTGLSAILIGAGYIVGLEIGATLLAGYFIAWLMGIPLIAAYQGMPPEMEAYDCAMQIWSKYIRMVGVGVMITGGIWTVISLLKSVKSAIGGSIKAIRKSSNQEHLQSIRTERDIPIPYVGAGIVLLTLLLAGLVYSLLSDVGFAQDATYILLVATVTVVTLVMTFLASIIIAYITGNVGSSSSPISGVIIMGVLFISLTILAFSFQHLGHGVSALSLSAVTVLLGAVVGASSVVSCDNMQDLKAGQILGATPWKQQVMLIVGSLITCLIISPVLNLLLKAYGIGDVLPVDSMDASQAMAAPKAALMAALSQGVFERSLDWNLIGIGGLIGVACIILNVVLKRMGKSWQISILTFALGFYMPLDIILPAFIGGFIAYLAERSVKKKESHYRGHYESAVHRAQHRGLLMASGIVAGEAIVGVIIAGLIVFVPTFRDLSQASLIGEPFKILLGSSVFSFICYYLYKTASQLKAS